MSSPVPQASERRPRRLTPLKLLVIAQLALILGIGVAVVARFPVWALVDERAHFTYVETVADHQRLPYSGRDFISPQTEAVDEGVYPRRARLDPRHRGLAGRSYESFQPPLYYVVAAPVFALSGDYTTKVRLLRIFNLLLVGAAIAILFLLAREVCGKRHLAAFSVALTAFLWPGVLVRSITISNASLELVLGLAVLLALWRATSRRDGRWLVAAGALMGLGLLTRLSIVYLLPLLIGAAIVLLRQDGWRTHVRAAVLALVLPPLVLAPWLAVNVDRYHALTASRIVRAEQEKSLNPTGHRFVVADLPAKARGLENGVIAEEWWVEFLKTRNRVIRDVFFAIFLLVPLALAFKMPRPGRRRVLALLAAPLGLGVVLMAIGTLAANWDFFYPRYLAPAVVAYTLFGAAVLSAVVRRERALAWTAVGLTVAFGLLWLSLSSVKPFTPRPAPPPAHAQLP